MYNINHKDHSEMNEKIHSGQFMISKYDEESDIEDIRDNNPDSVGYKFDSSNLKQNFQFVEKAHPEHRLEIDESLATMLQFLSIAMSGKITNPKWNSFKGVKFHQKDKIRLNNIIWREYHMQFVKKLKPVVVQFASPLSDIVQINGNVVLEGKFWKRKINIIVHQYKKWREYSKNRVPCHHYENKQSALFDSILVQSSLYRKMYSNSPPAHLNDIFMDLDDFNLPIDDDDAATVQHNCQIIQPQLTNLQPRMESSIDFLNDYFCAPQKPIKAQKPFSSETSLSVKPREMTEIRNIYFNCPISNYSDNKMDGFSSTKILESSPPMAKCHKRRSNVKPQNQYQHKPFQLKGTNGSANLCKTPNLLSILLQPILPPSTQTPLHQTSPLENVMYDVPAAVNKSSLVVTTSNMFTNHHGEMDRSKNSSMSMAKYEPSYNTDLNTYIPLTIDYSKQYSAVTPKYPKSVQSSVYNQSSRIKHNLTANNIVQQYLDELSDLLLSTRDQNKISKAALLHKASENIKRLHKEKQRLQAEIVMLQSEIDSLQNRFSAFCSQLPATGVCVSSNKSSEGLRWFEDFVMKNSLENWKFYIFSMMFESLFTGYNNSVSTVSMETLAHNVASWLEKECSLVKLRLIVINGMRTLSRRTSFVHNPIRLQSEMKDLIDTHNQSQSFIVSPAPGNYHQITYGSGARPSSDLFTFGREKCTTNSSSCSQLLNNDPMTSKCTERQDT